MGLIQRRFFVTLAGARQGLARKHVNRRANRGRRQRRGGQGLLGRMAVIVVLEIFEDVADIEEGVAVKTDVHEGRLHTGKDAGDFSFVDAADQREFFLALDVDFD